MRFTDTFLRQVRDRVSIAEYAGKRLAWDKRKTRPAAGDYWACCPFHQEKSSSFHVLETKGIFNCFGCGEKGDVFGLAMRLEGLSFPEAVAMLAERAGMELPTDERHDRGEDDRRKRLVQAAARAARLYADALAGREGKEAREYLKSRGFDAELCERFGIGYAPGGYTWLIDKLKAENFKIEELVAAGLAREGDEGKRPIDTFRDRVTFEITDTSGRVIGFGGRALKKDEKAKYINSPESALYSKGRVLYRMKQARELLAKTKAPGLVVGEGYLDVIAFERAGIAAVAPCGTSLTEEQLQLLWRSGGEPTFCFDGDTAGKRAADRALDLALPHLAPGHTVRIAYAPQGQDPDDIFRSSGPEALAALIAAASPASDAIFEREKARHGLATPEARAAFQAALKEAANSIADADTKRAYFSDFMSRANAALRAERQPAPQQQGGNGERRPWGKNAPPPGATQELKARAPIQPRPAAENFLRAACDYPDILARFADWLDRMAIADPELTAIRDALVQLADAPDADAGIDREALTLHLTGSGQDRAAARVSRWKNDEKPAGAKKRGQEGYEAKPAEWLVHVERGVVLPALKEELDELRPKFLELDPEAFGRLEPSEFARFQALSKEVQILERRAREAKLDDVQEEETGGLVA